MAANIQPPTYKDGMSLSEYIRQVDKFNETIKQDKYIAILDYINDMLGLDDDVKHTSLRGIKINNSYITKNNKHLHKVLIKHKENIERNFSIEVNPDDSKPNYPVYILTKVLKDINFKLIQLKTCYIIKN